MSQISRKNEVSAEIPSGLPRMMPYILASFSAQVVLYAILYYTFRESTSILGFLPSPADEYCVDVSSSSTCSRSDLFAFQITSGFPFLFCGVTGFYTWYISGRSHSTIPLTPQGRLFGYIPEAELIAAIFFSYQFFDFIVSISIPEHCTTIMMTHHAMAATVGWCSVRYQYLQHYGVYYLGLSEVSSIFLVIVDLSKYFPPIPGSLYDQFVGICGPAFVLSFTIYRVIMWWPISLQLFRDVYEVLKSGQASKLRPGKEWVLFVFLGLNLPLGVLQLYWFGIIVEEVQKVLS